MVSHPLLEAIAAYTKAVKRGQVDCTLERCPCCGQRPAGFKRHDRRKRWFHVIVGRVVQRVRSAVSRWKCLCCKRPFVLYPDFALPRKRYVRQDLARLSDRYLSQDDLSYRKAVQVNGMPVCYQAADGDDIDERGLWPSTLHRWIGFLGDLKQTLAEAWQLIRAKSPSCRLFRISVAVPSWKYRSQQRKALLQRCGRLLGAEAAYQNLFERSIFPHLATVCRWR